MNIEEALKKSIEGGYERAKGVFNANDKIRWTSNHEMFYLNPQF